MSERLQLGDAFDVGLVELHRNAEGDRRHDASPCARRRCPRCRRSDRPRRSPGAALPSARRRSRRPLSRISDRMKLVVPLMMPAIHSMRLAVRPSRSALMIGMPPATAASKATITPFSLRGGEDLVAVHGQQRLVGGDHVLAVGDGLQHQLLGDAVAADQFDDDVDVGIGRPPRTHRRPLRTRVADDCLGARRCRGRPPWRSRCRGRRGGVISSWLRLQTR